MLALGASGGILLMWDKHAIECIKEMMRTFSISCKFKYLLDQFDWTLSGVYGSKALFVGRVIRGFQLVGSPLVYRGRLHC
jgi:hypothetical protein